MPFGLDCSRRYDVVNRGFSGYNTSQALKILEQVFPKPEASGPKLKYLVSLIYYALLVGGDEGHHYTRDVLSCLPPPPAPLPPPKKKEAN